jgi:hypothetical protein
MFSGLQVGLVLVILALVLLIPVLVVVALRRLPHNASLALESNSSFVSPDSSHSNEAVLIIQAGGRVEHVNGLAREWFGLRADEPADLERLIRRARPAEDLFNLCARQGQKRLSVGGRLVEATSHQVPGPYPLMLITMRNVDLSKNLNEAGTDSSILQIVSDFGKVLQPALIGGNFICHLLNISHSSRRY